MQSLSIFFFTSCPCSHSLSHLCLSLVLSLITPPCPVCSSSPSQHAAMIWCCPSFLTIWHVCFYARMCIGVLSHVSFVWFWHKETLSWAQQIKSLQCLTLAELGWKLQSAFHCRLQQREPNFIYYSSNSISAKKTFMWFVLLEDRLTRLNKQYDVFVDLCRGLAFAS